MNSWQLALVVSVLALSIGYFMQTPEPVPESIAVHSAAPDDHVIIETPTQ